MNICDICLLFIQIIINISEHDNQKRLVLVRKQNISPTTLKGNYGNFYFVHWSHFDAGNSSQLLNFNFVNEFLL